MRQLSLRDASCCRVLVVNGGAFFFCWLRVTLLTLKVAPRSASSCWRASSSEPMRAFSPSMRVSSAAKLASAPGRRSWASRVQYLRHEGIDLALAIDYQPHGHALHARRPTGPRILLLTSGLSL